MFQAEWHLCTELRINCDACRKKLLNDEPSLSTFRQAQGKMLRINLQEKLPGNNAAGYLIFFS